MLIWTPYKAVYLIWNLTKWNSWLSKFENQRSRKSKFKNQRVNKMIPGDISLCCFQKWCQISDENSGCLIRSLTSNKLTPYVLDYGDFVIIALINSNCNLCTYMYRIPAIQSFGMWPWRITSICFPFWDCYAILGLKFDFYSSHVCFSAIDKVFRLIVPLAYECNKIQDFCCTNWLLSIQPT